MVEAGDVELNSKPLAAPRICFETIIQKWISQIC